MKQNQFGRSMIEMLGVLAIVGVLSVGGIAGYSKAMEKFKINKIIEEYSMLITGLIEYKDNMIKDNNIQLARFAKDANLIPETWPNSSSGTYINDSHGNITALYLSNKYIVIDIYFYLNRYTKTSPSKQKYDFCENLFINLAFPLASELQGFFLRGNGATTFYGTKYCNANDRKCLSDLTVAEASKECRKCIYENTGDCIATIVF